MDKMEFFEIRALLKYQWYSHKDSWEQARLISYIMAQVNSKNKMKMSDIIDFEWEKEANSLSNNEKINAVSNDEVKRLRAQAQNFASLL